MATTHLHQSTPQQRGERANPVEDPKLSRKLDQLITALDEQPPTLRRAWLRLQKGYLEECYVPRSEVRQ